MVAENGQLTYTFTIQNRGNTAVTAADDVTLRDVFKPILKNITVTYNGTAWSVGTEYTYSETTGEFVSAVGQITVPRPPIRRTRSPASGALRPAAAFWSSPERFKEHIRQKRGRKPSLLRCFCQKDD